MQRNDRPAKADGLLIRPARETGESPFGYPEVVARENGFDGLGDLLRAAGCDSAYKRVPVPHTGWLKSEARAHLGQFFPQSISRNMLAWCDDEPIPKRFLTVDRQRNCPRCLQERGRRPAAWDLVWASACLKHGVRLIDRCPKCRKALSWHRRDTTRCSCGFDLRQASPVPAEEGELLANSSLNQVGHGFSHPRATVSETARDLQDLPAGDICLVFRFLAIHVMRALPKRSSAKKLHCRAVSPIMEEIGAILADWPNSLRARLVAGDGCDRSRADTFGDAWKSARDLGESEARDFLLRGFDSAFASLHPHAAELRRGRFRVAREENLTWLTLEQASRVSGVSRERLRRLINDGVLSAKRVEFGRTHAWRIERAVLDRCLADQPSRMDLREGA